MESEGNRGMPEANGGRRVLRWWPVIGFLLGVVGGGASSYLTNAKTIAEAIATTRQEVVRLDTRLTAHEETQKTIRAEDQVYRDQLDRRLATIEADIKTLLKQTR